MPAAQLSKTPPPTIEEVQELLKRIANLLCPGHQHKITVPYIKAGEKTGYSMMIACRRESNITWQVSMSVNTFNKVIRRCRVLSALGGEGHPGMMTFEALSAWEGDQCDDILELLRIGHLKEGWWEDNPSRLSDMRRAYRKNPYNAGYMEYGSHNYVAYSGSIPKISPLFPGDGGKDKRYRY